MASRNSSEVTASAAAETTSSLVRDPERTAELYIKLLNNDIDDLDLTNDDFAAFSDGNEGEIEQLADDLEMLYQDLYDGRITSAEARTRARTYAGLPIESSTSSGENSSDRSIDTQPSQAPSTENSSSNNNDGTDEPTTPTTSPNAPAKTKAPSTPKPATSFSRSAADDTREDGGKREDDDDTTGSASMTGNRGSNTSENIAMTGSSSMDQNDGNDTSYNADFLGSSSMAQDIGTSTPDAASLANVVDDPSIDSSSSSKPNDELIVHMTEDKSSNVGMIMSVIAAVLGIVLLVALFFLIRNRRKQRNLERGLSSQGATPFGQGAPHTPETGAFAAIPPSGNSLGDDSILSDLSFKPQSGLWEEDSIIAVRIPLEKIHVIELVGRGSYGEVYRGAYMGQTVAIKMLLSSQRKDLNMVSELLEEVKLQASLEHCCIVSFIGVAWNALTDLSVVTEYMDGGDLRTLLNKYDKDKSKEYGFDREKIGIALHIAHALVYLHSLQPQVIHRDLKSRNVLLDSQNNAKLADFGASRRRRYDADMTIGIGTSLWMAPEVLLSEKYDASADIYSFGVVLSELDAHHLPFANERSSDSGKRPDVVILQLVSLGKISIQFSDSACDEMQSLGRDCVSLDPSKRPTAPEAMYRLHRALKGYDQFHSQNAQRTEDR